MTEQALSSKDFAVADVFAGGIDSLSGSKAENAKLIAQIQKSGPAAKLAAAALAEKFPPVKSARLTDYAKARTTAVKTPERGKTR